MHYFINLFKEFKHVIGVYLFFLDFLIKFDTTVCFRNGRGNINCHLLQASHAEEGEYLNGYGGTQGLGSLGCTSQYTAIGTNCLALPAEDQIPKSQAVLKCIDDGGTLFNPSDKIQNEMIGALMEDVGLTEIWTDITKNDATGDWMSGSKLLSKFNIDWGDDEPSSQLGANCAVLSKVKAIN